MTMIKKAIILLLTLALCTGSAYGLSEGLHPEEAFTPAPINMKPAHENHLPYMGLRFTLPEALMDMISANEVFAYGTGEINPETQAMRYAFFNYLYVPEGERGSIPMEAEAFDAWSRTIPRLGRVSVFSNDMLAESDIAELTGFPLNEIIGEHGGYTFVASRDMASDAMTEDADGAQALVEEMLASLTPETPRPVDDQFIWFTEAPFVPVESIGAFDTVDLHGSAVTESILKSSKITLLNIWGTWCKPCIEELPYLAELSQELDSAEVQILGLMQDAVDMDTHAHDPERIELGKVISERTGAAYPMLIPDASLLGGIMDNLVTRREDQDIDSRAIPAYFAQHLNAVKLRQVQVKDDGVIIRRKVALQRLLAIRRGIHGIPQIRKPLRQCLQHGGFILNNQQFHFKRLPL